MNRCKGKISLSFIVLVVAFSIQIKPAPALPLQTDSLYREWQLVKKNPETRSDTEKIELLNQLGDAINYFSPDSSIFYYQEALGLAKATGAIQQEGALLNKIGYTHYILGEYNEALPYIGDALNLFDSIGNALGKSISLNHISLIYETQKDYQKALDYQHKSISFAKIAGDSNRLASNFFNLSMVYDEMSAYDSALAYVNRTIKMSKSLGNYHILTMASNRKGEIYYHMRRYAEAEEAYLSVLNSKVYDDNWETCYAYAGLAQSYREVGRYEESIAAGLKSLAIAKEMKAKGEIVRVAEILFKTFEVQRDYAKALEMHVLYKAYSDSVFNEAKEREINYLHLKQNEIERDRLINQNKLQQAKIEQNNLWVGIFCIGAVLMIVWGLVLYRNNRQKMLLNTKLIKKNQSIVERNAKIEQQNNQLNELNESKNQLLSIIGHDMRSPINNIKTILEIIKAGRMSEVDQQRIFNELHRTVTAVADTMENMLTWASSQLDGIQINPGRVNLAEAIEEQIQFSMHAADQKRIAILHEKEENMLVWADVNHVKTVARNLLGNAIKFTKPGGTITVSYVRDNQSVGLQIEDTGVGIPPDKLGEVFSFKGRSQSLGTNNERGTGIGLMMSRDFIESNGGKIEVESQLGKGSVFTVWLPVADPVREPAPSH